MSAPLIVNQPSGGGARPAPPQEKPLKKGREYTLVAEAAAFEGGCVARYEGMAVFVPRAAP